MVSVKSNKGMVECKVEGEVLEVIADTVIASCSLIHELMKESYEDRKEEFLEQILSDIKEAVLTYDDMQVDRTDIK